MRTIVSSSVSSSIEVTSTRAVFDVRKGLSSDDAQRRLAEYGLNEIQREEATSALILLAHQFASPVIWLLLGASAVSLALGEYLDAIAIGVIVIINAVIGFLQEHRAERAVMALRSMTAPRARVLRDGQSVIVPASSIVPGDILQIRLVIWDVGDSSFDSTALIDGFQWLSNATLPVTSN